MADPAFYAVPPYYLPDGDGYCLVFAARSTPTGLVFGAAASPDGSPATVAFQEIPAERVLGRSRIDPAAVPAVWRAACDRVRRAYDPALRSDWRP